MGHQAWKDRVPFSQAGRLLLWMASKPWGYWGVGTQERDMPPERGSRWAEVRGRSASLTLDSAKPASAAEAALVGWAALFL